MIKFAPVVGGLNARLEIRTFRSASGLGLCWKQAVKMVRCFSVRTVLPLLERPFPGPSPLFDTRMSSRSDFGSDKSWRPSDRTSWLFPLSSWLEKSLVASLPDGYKWYKVAWTFGFFACQIRKISIMKWFFLFLFDMDFFFVYFW